MWLDAERRRLEQRLPLTRDAIVYGIAALLGSIVWILPQMAHLRKVPDAGDPIFSAWRLAALAHQLLTDPRHLWKGNIFYPLPLTLTYSDSLFLQTLLGLPFLSTGADPLRVANAMMVISYPARGLAYYYFLWRVTGEPRAALIGGLLAAWSPFHPDHYSQLELQWTMFVPLALLGCARVLAWPRWRTGAFFGAMVAAQCLSCMYVAVMLVSFLVPFGLLLAIAWHVRPSKQLAAALLAAVLVLAPVAIALAVPYLGTRAVHGERTEQEVYEGSADGRDYGDATSRLQTYAGRPGHHHVERELFPGTSSLVLAGIGALPPLSGVAIATLVSGAAAFDWSLGFKGVTYGVLYRTLAPYRGMRVPARFSALVDAALAILGAFGAWRVLRTVSGETARTMLVAVMAVAVLWDLRMDPDLQLYLSSMPPIYHFVTRDMVLADMPDGHTVDYMYFSTKHWAHLLGGYSGYFPPAPDLDRAKREFPSPESLVILRRLGATHLTYNCAFDPPEERCQKTLRELDANPTIELVTADQWRGAPVRLYRFK